MKAIGWKLFSFAFLPQMQCLMFPLANANLAGPCFSSSFSRAIGYILEGFLLGEITVSSKDECKSRCVVSANCLSLNILTNSDGSFVCQLNSDRKKNAVKEQFVQHEAGQYYGLKEKKLCTGNGKTCSSDSSWFAFNQSYFQFVDAKTTFEEARKVCLEKKGDLASTSSEEEQNYLFTTFMETHEDENLRMWVGLNDIAREGVFVWTDGSPNTHARFGDGFPDNYYEGENCVVMVKPLNGGYSDILCSYEYRFFCETSYESLYG